MDSACKGCGQQMQQLHPLTGLCWGCHEIHNEDGPYHDDEDYEEVAGSCDECGGDIDSEEAIEGLCDQCSWWRHKAIHG